MHKHHGPFTRRGFTIVELLIVIMVIAILAAISIVAYTGIQNRAADSAVKSDIANFGKILALHRVDNSHYLRHSTELNNHLSKITSSGYISHGNALQYCYDPATDEVAVGGVSKSGKGFVFQNGELTEVTEGWPQTSGIIICGNYFGIPMVSGSFTGWRNPSNANWSGHTYP